MDKLLDVVQVTEGIQLQLCEAENSRDGCYISLKQLIGSTSLPCEVMISPAEVPDIIRALTKAALKLSIQDVHCTGSSDRERYKKMPLVNLISKYYSDQISREQLVETIKLKDNALSEKNDHDERLKN